MANPRTKRPFAGAALDPSQRQITSFFSSEDSFAAVDIANDYRPILPANVQSNLLSVGMRIRKSVPEGYKVNTTSAFKLWTDNTPAMAPRPTTSSSPSAKVYLKELLPFCGINKVGGLAVQSEHYLDESDAEVPPLDALPELTLSQETVDSNASSEPSRKRFFDENDAEDPSQTWEQSSRWDEEVSPRSLAPVGWGNARVMATPHSRLSKSAALRDLDQENMSVDGDFDEAEFLVVTDESDMDVTAE